MNYLVLIFLCLISAQAKSFNADILEAINTMPVAGGYSVKKNAFAAFDAAIDVEDGVIHLKASEARPSFCSSATYLVFIKVIQQLQQAGRISLKPHEISLLDFHNQKDGDGIWGRWNSNGPGVAKLFKDLKCGKNFEDFEQAQRGDFLKLFWTDEIGKKEFGHLVIYLGHTVESVSFWSSNTPSGYGMKTIPRNKVKWAIFSRLTSPKNIKRVDNLPYRDPFLSEMLTRAFTRKEVRALCSIK